MLRPGTASAYHWAHRKLGPLVSSRHPVSFSPCGRQLSVIQLNSGFGATAPTGPSVLPLRSQPLFIRRPRPEAPLFWRFVGIGWREQRRLGGRRTELGALGKGVGQFGLGQSLQETASEGRGFVQAPKPEGTELRTSFYVLKASPPCSDLKIILILRPQPFHTRQRIRVCSGVGVCSSAVCAPVCGLIVCLCTAYEAAESTLAKSTDSGARWTDLESNPSSAISSGWRTWASCLTILSQFLHL